jgi:predicted ArsR family transcriptional regulator
MAMDITSEQTEKIKKLSIEEKLNYIKESLSDQGFSIEWEKIGDNYMIKEIACPFFHVGQAHPEVCAIDKTLISSILSIPAEKVECVLDGDNQCSYIITQQQIAENK